MDGYGFPGWTREEYEAWIDAELHDVSTTYPHDTDD